MTEATEIAVDLQLSPCSSKMENATTIQAFNDILADFILAAVEQSGDFSIDSGYSIGGRIESQSIHQQDGIWSRMGRFFRKFYTKRLSGDPVGGSRMEVKEILTLSFDNSTANDVDTDVLSDFVIGRFANVDSATQLRNQLLASEDTKSFFSDPKPLEVLALKQNRYNGIKLATLLGSVGVVVVVLAFLLRFFPRRKLGKRSSSEYTSNGSLPPPGLIDISNEMSSIGVDSPASVYLASKESKAARRKSGQATMQELPPIAEETDYDLEQGLPPAAGHYNRGPPAHSRPYSPVRNSPTTRKDLRLITVVVGAGYPEELGFTVTPGPEALEINEVLDDSPLPLRVGDMIAEVDGQNATRWNEADFEEHLVEHRRHNKTLLIARPSRSPNGRGRDDRHDDCGDSNDGALSYFSDCETDCGDETTMMDDSTYYD